MKNDNVFKISNLKHVSQLPTISSGHQFMSPTKSWSWPFLDLGYSAKKYVSCFWNCLVLHIYIYYFIYHYIVYYNRYRYIDIPPYITKINVFKPPSKGSNSNESPFLGPEVTSRTSLLEPLEERLLVCRGAGFHGMVGWVDHSVIPGNQWWLNWQKWWLSGI
jgi:hypothetical protein